MPETDDDWKDARPTARRAGMGSGAPRPGTVALLAAILVLGALTLAGWQAGWPRAIFGPQRPALESVAGSPGASASVPAQSAPANPASASPAGANPDSPAAVVQAYFSAINDRDYQTAWQLGGKNTGSSYTEFVQGFSTTANDTLTILSTAGNVVTAQLVAEQNDGTSKTFEGTYTVTGGVITNFAVQQTG